VADTIKFKTVVPAAIEFFSTGKKVTESAIRGMCRDIFRRQNIAMELVRIIENLMESSND